MSTKPNLRSVEPADESVHQSAPALESDRAFDASNEEARAKASSVAHREEALVALAREGERGAWQRLYQTNYDKVLGRVRYLCGDLSLAEELTQEAFVQAMLKVDKFEGRSTFASWLRSVALNVVRNHWRSQRSTAKAHAKLAIVHAVREVNQDAEPELDLQRKQRSVALYRALERVPENLREVFVLRDIEGLDREEVARVLSISPGNVSVRANRARHRIREELRAMGALPGGA